jgi:L-asparaginase
MRKPSVLLIYTGGTIGMLEDPRTGSLRPMEFSHLIDAVPELARFNVDLDWVSFEHPIDSSDAGIKDWQRIATMIEVNYSGYDGFVVLHGTDTMSYSASALSFMLHNLAKPVVFTGSQLPVGRLRTDGKDNLITSIEIAAARSGERALINEVVLCFESNIYRGNRTMKFNTEDFDAFSSPNYPALATAGIHISYKKEHMLPSPNGAFKILKELEPRVAVLRLFPGITEQTVRSLIEIEGIQGILLETYGSGNAPSAKWFISALKDALSKGIVLANVTQCSKGFVEQGRYETSSALHSLGVWGAGDMTFEAAVTKLMFVLAQELSREEQEYLYSTGLRGELTTYSAIV